MRLKEYKEVTKKESVTIGYECDICKKIDKGTPLSEDWHEISAHHNNWGNDSCDSYKEYIVCSPECYTKQLKEVIQDFEGYNTAEIDGMTIDFAKSLLIFIKK